MILSGCLITTIDVNFHLQKSLEIFDKNPADKICSKKDKVKEWKVSSLMPIGLIEISHKYIFFHLQNMIA